MSLVENEVLKDAVITGYLDGRSVRVVAVEQKISYGTAMRILAAANIPRRPRGNPDWTRKDIS